LFVWGAEVACSESLCICIGWGWVGYDGGRGGSVCGSGGGVGSGIMWGLVDIDDKGPCENVGPA